MSPRISSSRLPKKTAGQVLATPLSDFWRGGNGPSHNIIDKVINDHGIDLDGTEGFSKEKKIYDIMYDIKDDDVAESLLDGLLVGIRMYSMADFRRSLTSTKDRRARELQDAVASLGLELTDEAELLFPDDDQAPEPTAPRRAPLSPDVVAELRAPAPWDAKVVAADEARGQDSKSIFLVHGHDRLTLLEVAYFVRQITGIESTILNDQPNAGQTLIEKFEGEASPAAFAIVMMTPDDLGKAKGKLADIRDGEDVSLAHRARQNVVFELGYFYGALGRRNVAVINAGIENPGDIQGVVYIPWDHEWQRKLARELRQAGFTVTI